MGQLVGQLTNPGSALVDANTGQPMYMGSPQNVLAKTGPMVANSAGSDPNNPLNFNPSDKPPLPKITKPSYQEAAQYGATPGGANAASPGLTKAGKLVTLLTQGLQGALAGRAAQEQAIIQSGGRRAGGIGTGFEAGYMLPWQRAQAAQQYQLGQAALTPVETPYGEMPAEYAAKTVLPAFIRAGATEQAAQTGAQAKTQSAQIGAGARTQAAEIQSRYKVVPGVGLIDTQGGNGAGSLLAREGTPITPEIAQQLDMPPQFVGLPMTPQTFSSFMNAQRFSEQPVEGAGDQYLVNRNPVSPNFGKKTPLGIGIPALGRAVQVGDVNNPGQTKYMTAGQAVASGAPGTQSASVQVPKKAAASEVPTKIGDQRVAFTTMIQHAELLREAAQALQNGDVRTLSGLRNAFKNEFGYAGPITAQAIADAYGGEVTNVISKGHITDAEAAKTGRTIDPSKQNFQTINSVLNAYQALAQSKMNMLNQQEQSAIQKSQPNSGPKIGEVRTINGQPAHWDGKGWLPGKK